MAKISVLDKYRRTRKPVLVKTLISKEEYVDLLETVLVYLRQLERLSDRSFNIIMEIKFNALLNHKYRQDTFNELKDFADELYEEIHT